MPLISAQVQGVSQMKNACGHCGLDPDDYEDTGWDHTKWHRVNLKGMNLERYVTPVIAERGQNADVRGVWRQIEQGSDAGRFVYMPTTKLNETNAVLDAGYIGGNKVEYDRHIRALLTARNGRINDYRRDVTPSPCAQCSHYRDYGNEENAFLACYSLRHQPFGAQCASCLWAGGPCYHGLEDDMGLDEVGEGLWLV